MSVQTFYLDRFCIAGHSIRKVFDGDCLVKLSADHYFCLIHRAFSHTATLGASRWSASRAWWRWWASWWTEGSLAFRGYLRWEQIRNLAAVLDCLAAELGPGNAWGFSIRNYLISSLLAMKNNYIRVMEVQPQPIWKLTQLIGIIKFKYSTLTAPMKHNATINCFILKWIWNRRPELLKFTE